jgi:hypothetical protein
MHIGRYGKDAEDPNLLFPIYAGNPQFVRGYAYDSFRAEECRSADGASGACPAFDRLLGSRIGVVNAELRIPLLGVEGLSVIRSNLLPVELTPFVDGAVTWSRGASPELRFARGDEARTSVDPIPVFSAGLSTRINLFGFFVMEAFYAYPFQRPDRKGHWGFQLAPGW